MSSREQILQSLRDSNAKKVDLPKYDFSGDDGFLLEDFIDMATSSGIEMIHSEEGSLADILGSLSKEKNIQNSLEAYSEEYPVLLDESDPFEGGKLPDVFVCRAAFGVAENAAMWLDDSLLPSRILAFLPEELIVVLKRENLVSKMQQAYEIVETINYSYGLFMAGPSKTADIEQTLVTGAQGAKKLTVYLE